MFFVSTFIPCPHKPEVFLETNVKIGGFRTHLGAINQAKLHAPAIIYDQKRTIIGQTIGANYPHYVGKLPNGL